MSSIKAFHPAISAEQQLSNARWQFWLIIATTAFLITALVLLLLDWYWTAALSGVVSMYSLSEAYSRLRKMYFDLTGITFIPDKPVDTAPPKP
jgi:hypothetical protein